MEILIGDIRTGLRTLRRNTGFTVLAVLTLAAGLGVNVAIFSVVDALMLRPLPVRRPDELVQLSLPAPQGPSRTVFSYPLIHALMERRDLVAGVAGSTSTGSLAASAGGVNEQLFGTWVTGDYWETLGPVPLVGRLLTAADDRIGAPPTVVISERLWRRRFGGDPWAVGSSIAIEGIPTTIVGVAPRGFAGITVGQFADLTLPMGIAPQIRPDRRDVVESGSSSLRVLLRLKPGMTRTQLESVLRVSWTGVVDAAIPNTVATAAARKRLLSARPLISPGSRGWTGLRTQFGTSLLALLAVMAIVLMAICANVANLVLAKATHRRDEIQVRLALGGTRVRVVRQFLTEGALLSALAAAASMVIAGIGTRGLVYLLSQGAGRAVELSVGPDWRLVGFTACLSIVTTLASSLLPAVCAVNHLGEGLKGRVHRGWTRMGSVLAAAQISVSVLLLIPAGLFLVTMDNLRKQDLGFRHDDVLIFDVDGPRTGRDRAALMTFYSDLMRRTASLPGVRAVSFSLTTPLGDTAITHGFDIDGMPVGDGETPMGIVSPGYFRTLRTSLMQGRDFSESDRLGTPPVAIVNEAFARRYLPGSAIGRRLGIAGRVRQEMEVIGVVKDAPYQNIRTSPPTVFAPFAQRGGGGPITVEVAIAGAGDVMARDIDHLLTPYLPTPVVVRALTDQVNRSVAQEHVFAMVITILAALVVAVAAVGLYGLFACIVEQRRAEIGVRMAVGADPRHVLFLILRDAGRLVVMGIAAGVPLSWLAVAPVRSMFFGVASTNPEMALAAAGIVSLSALAATLIPAYRAAQSDPMVSLRR
jgi:predicted permease